MIKALSILRTAGLPPCARIVLDHGERHLRRKVLTLDTGERVLVDLREPQHLHHGDRLVLEDGRHIEVVAADEALYEIRAKDTRALSVLAWHIGNRHLPAQIDSNRILIARDHVIGAMLAGLGAKFREIAAPFQPEHGAYHSHAHGHDPAHGHSHAPAHDRRHGHDHDRAHNGND